MHVSRPAYSRAKESQKAIPQVKRSGVNKLFKPSE